jgi:O-Antigen ligase
MTNPASAMRMLITYAICIPVAIFVGYLLTNPLDYGTLGFIGLVIAFIISPVFIKWHYPILVFGLGCPMYCFFLVGRPPLWQVVALISLLIALVERATGNRRFLSVPVATWPLLYIAAMAYLTSRLTGGIGLHQLGGGGGGGKKYLYIFIGIAGYFALTSRVIPKDKRNLYIGLFILSGLAGALGDIGASLGGPLRALNLLFPSSLLSQSGDGFGGSYRLATLGAVFGTVMTYMLVRYGMRGIFLAGSPWRAPFFLLMFPFTMLGGFRSFTINALVLYTILFFLDGLHRSRLLPLLLLLGALLVASLTFTSDHLPLPVQRSLCFLPFKWEGSVVADADASVGWRQAIWKAEWPQVPNHLLLGKGYALSETDFEFMGGGAFAGLGSDVDAAQQSLAISGDYHNGPLSTLIPFGIWGALGFLWLQAACVFVAYRNYRYGDPEIRAFNAYQLAINLWGIVSFYFIFGAFDGAVADMAKNLGFSIALNWGVCRAAAKSNVNPRIKPVPLPTVQPAPHLGRA